MVDATTPADVTSLMNLAEPGLATRNVVGSSRNGEIGEEGIRSPNPSAGSSAIPSLYKMGF